MTSPSRFGILGPRRTRQGLAPWIAPMIEAAGGVVVAIGARKWGSLDKAAAEVEASLGHGVEGYVGVDAMLANAQLDALVITTPAAAHEDAILGALDRGVHVFVEEPVVEPKPLATDKLEMLADSFTMSELHLKVNAQWPLTLPSYHALHPAARGAAVDTFEMHVAQARTGLEMMPDSIVHALSMLQALCPGADPVLRSPEIDIKTEDASVIEVTFDYDDGARVVPSKVGLTWARAPERAVSYGINDLLAVGRMTDGELAFHDGDRSVPVPDPLAQSVREFVDIVANGLPVQTEVRAVERMRMIESLLA